MGHAMARPLRLVHRARGICRDCKRRIKATAPALIARPHQSTVLCGILWQRNCLRELWWNLPNFEGSIGLAWFDLAQNGQAGAISEPSNVLLRSRCTSQHMFPCISLYWIWGKIPVSCISMERGCNGHYSSESEPLKQCGRNTLETSWTNLRYHSASLSPCQSTCLEHSNCCFCNNVQSSNWSTRYPTIQWFVIFCIQIAIGFLDKPWWDTSDTHLNHSINVDNIRNLVMSPFSKVKICRHQHVASPFWWPIDAKRLWRGQSWWQPLEQLGLPLRRDLVWHSVTYV